MGRLPEWSKRGAKDSPTWQQAGHDDAKGFRGRGAWNKGFEADKCRGWGEGEPMDKCKFPSLESIAVKAL